MAVLLRARGGTINPLEQALKTWSTSCVPRLGANEEWEVAGGCSMCLVNHGTGASSMRQTTDDGGITVERFMFRISGLETDSAVIVTSDD